MRRKFVHSPAPVERSSFFALSIIAHILEVLAASALVLGPVGFVVQAKGQQLKQDELILILIIVESALFMIMIAEGCKALGVTAKSTQNIEAKLDSIIELQEMQHQQDLKSDEKPD